MEWVQADWPAPAGVHVVTTTRSGGVSVAPWNSLNLGGNTGDDPGAVAENRSRLRDRLPGAPGWMRQVHGTAVLRRESLTGNGDEADAVTCATPGLVCAVLTADCLPVAFCNSEGSRVALAHAGWRGLAAGVLEATLASLDSPPGSVMAWIGPGIGSGAFEIGDEVREAFMTAYPESAPCFHRPGERWHGDLAAIARHALERAGVGSISGGDFCTYTDGERFYSYRRDGETGRMATLAWMD